MTIIKVVLKEPENGVDTFVIGWVFKYGIIYKFERQGLKDIPIGAELRIECLDESVWEFDINRIESWEVVLDKVISEK